MTKTEYWAVKNSGKMRTCPLCHRRRRPADICCNSYEVAAWYRQVGAVKTLKTVYPRPK